MYQGSDFIFSGVLENQNFVLEPSGHCNHTHKESEMSLKRSLGLSVQRRHSRAITWVVGLRKYINSGHAFSAGFKTI